MAKKVYAIKEGYDSSTNSKVENKIVDTWAECLKYVKGVKGAKYKSFEDINEAKKFLTEGSKMLKKNVDKYPEDCLHIYVDGSYNINTKKYAYGLVAVRDNVVEYIESNAAMDTAQSNIRQIAGELEGAIKGVEYAISKKENKVVIFHDYEGVAHHATGFWERREPSSIEYYEKMNSFMNEGIEIIFVKVDSHTGDLYNELVDEKCKEQLGINSDKLVQKWLLSNVINVTNTIVKEEIISLISEGENNIHIKDIENNNIVLEEDNKFDVIIAKYLDNKEVGIKYIYNLTENGKVDFIKYLMDNKI